MPLLQMHEQLIYWRTLYKMNLSLMGGMEWLYSFCTSKHTKAYDIEIFARSSEYTLQSYLRRLLLVVSFFLTFLGIFVFRLSLFASLTSFLCCLRAAFKSSLSKPVPSS